MMSLFLHRFPFTLLFLFHFRLRLFQTPLLERGCNGLKHATKGLREVKEGGISARKAGLL